MTPLNKQQLDRIRDERTEQIKQAALRIFSLHGYKGTKTSTIATEAGISEGLIYRYFHSKEELFTTLVQELIQEASRELGQLQNLPGTPYEQIKALTQNMLDEKDKYSFMLIQRTRNAEDIPDKAGQIIKEFSIDDLIHLIIPVFVKGQEAGDFIAGDPHKLLSWYLYIVNSLIIEDQWNEEYGMPDVDFLMRCLVKD